METEISISIDTGNLTSYDDEYLASLWHVGQINPASIENENAGRLAEIIGREIIRRWVLQTGVPLWQHQGHHAARCELAKKLQAT